MSNIVTANIFAASQDKNLLADFKSKLSKRNYHVKTFENNALIEAARTNRPDLIVIDIANGGASLIEHLKSDPDCKHIPLIALVKEKTPDLYEQAIQMRADDIFIYSFDIEEFFVHIKPLLRLSTMFLELENRVKLAQSLDIPATADIASDDDEDYRILLISPKDGDRATIETVLGGNCQIDSCDDFFLAEEMLSKGNFDATIISIDESTRENALSLSARLRNNPRLFNLPVLLINNASLQDRLEAYRRGITRITNRPLNRYALHAKIRMLVRRQRLRWSIRKAMDSTRAPLNIDQGTSAYTNHFFNTNLNNQVSNAQRWQRPLSIIIFSIGNLASITEQFGTDASNTLMKQVYQWIAGLSRVEDCLARLSANEFAIALPDTPAEEAQIVMHRIAGILSYTDFALKDVYQPVSIWVECALGDVQIDDDASTLIERTRGKLA